MRRLEVLMELINSGASKKELADFFALTQEEFELWDRIVNGR